MQVNEKQAAMLLKEQDHIVIFAHRKPDGDAIGSCFALFYALKQLGKKVRIECADPLLHGRYSAIFGDYEPEDFAPSFLVAADVAEESLLAGAHERYGKKIGLCIDHHKSNSFYAEKTLLDSKAAAAAELVLRLLLEMGIKPEKRIADAIFTGLVTDTGCFRFSNTTADTHIAAAEMLRWGADSQFINRLMFETKSRGRLLVDKMLAETMTYHFDGLCAMVYLPADTAERFHVTEEELDGVSGMPRTIEGVLAGVTIREKEDGGYRVSLRTQHPADASRICGEFDGGGHANAAGCIMEGPLERVREKLLDAVRRELDRGRNS